MTLNNDLPKPVNVTPERFVRIDVGANGSAVEIYRDTRRTGRGIEASHITLIGTHRLAARTGVP